MTNAETISIGLKLQITKGCNARSITKGVSIRVLEIEPMGAEYSHSVKVRFQLLNGFGAGKTFVFYARHVNRLSDSIVRLNDGNPSHVIEVRHVA